MDSPAATLAAKVAWNFGSWRTIEMRVREDLSNFQGEYTWTSVPEHYIEVRGGGRYSETRCTKADITVNRRIDYWDGSKAAQMMYWDKDPELQHMVNIKRDFALEDQFGQSSRPTPIGFFCVGRTPLNEALLKAEYLGTDRVNGKDCHAFLFARVKYGSVVQDLVYDLDAESATPLKVVSYADAVARNKGTALWTWTCSKVETTQGHEIPTIAALNTFEGDGTTLIGTNTYTVESVKYDEEYPASMFWPTYQPGLSVFDSIAGTHYVVPGERPASTETLVAPPAAIAPSGWSSTTSAVTLGLGIAVLLAGGLLWWRRR